MRLSTSSSLWHIPAPSDVSPKTPWELFFDGGIQKNPGGSFSYGWSLQHAGVERVCGWGRVAAAEANTVNVAEYRGLIEGVRFLAGHPDLTGPVPVRIWGDSQLVVYQVQGTYRSRERLYELRMELKDTVQLARQRFCIGWISREANARADELTHAAKEPGTWEQWACD